MWRPPGRVCRSRSLMIVRMINLYRSDPNSQRERADREKGIEIQVKQRNE